MERRNFLKGAVASLFTLPIASHHNLIAKNLIELDKHEDLLIEYENSIPVAPLYPTPETSVDLRNLTNAINSGPISGREGLYGFSYDKIFEKYKIASGCSMEFPLDFLTSQQSEAIILDTTKVPTRIIGDYVRLTPAEFSHQGEANVRHFQKSQWDVIKQWIDSLIYGLQEKIARSSWDCLMIAAETNVPIPTKGLLDYNIHQTIGLAKTIFHRDRLRCTDIFLPTHTYIPFKLWTDQRLEELSDRRDIGVEEAWLFNSHHNNVIVRGVNIHHAPELSWYTYGKDIGIACDLSRRTIGVHASYDEPIMTPLIPIDRYFYQASIWQDLAIGVFSPTQVRLIQ